jgi:hypothetical protein
MHSTAKDTKGRWHFQQYFSYIMAVSINGGGSRFSLGTPVSFTNKTDPHYIAEILLKVAINTISLTIEAYFHIFLRKTHQDNHISHHLQH